MPSDSTQLSSTQGNIGILAQQPCCVGGSGLTHKSFVLLPHQNHICVYMYTKPE